MTMKDRLRLHNEIVESNQRKLKEWKGDSMMDSIKFPWEYTAEELAEMPEAIGEHGKCIDYRQEAFHDVHVFEDGHEERLYIVD